MTKEPLPISEKTNFRPLFITITVAIIVYFLFILWGGWESTLSAVKTIGVLPICLALMLSCINYGLRFTRWQMYLSKLGHHPPVLLSLRLYIAGFALTATPGKAGEAIRSLFLKKEGIPVNHTLGAFFGERMSDLLSVVILAMSGLWLYPQTRISIGIVAFLILFVVYAIQKDRWLKRIEKWATFLLPKRLAHIAESLFDMMLSFRSCFETTILLKGTFLGVLAWGAEGLAFYLILQSTGAEISLLTVEFIYGFGLLIGAITFLPGGLGGAEITMSQLLILNGIEPSIAIASTLIIRITTLWFSVLLGLIALPRK